MKRWKADPIKIIFTTCFLFCSRPRVTQEICRKSRWYRYLREMQPADFSMSYFVVSLIGPEMSSVIWYMRFETSCPDKITPLLISAFKSSISLGLKSCCKCHRDRGSTISANSAICCSFYWLTSRKELLDCLFIGSEMASIIRHMCVQTSNFHNFCSINDFTSKSEISLGLKSCCQYH